MEAAAIRSRWGIGGCQRDSLGGQHSSGQPLPAEMLTQVSLSAQSIAFPRRSPEPPGASAGGLPLRRCRRRLCIPLGRRRLETSPRQELRTARSCALEELVYLQQVTTSSRGMKSCSAEWPC